MLFRSGQRVIIRYGDYGGYKGRIAPSSRVVRRGLYYVKLDNGQTIIVPKYKIGSLRRNSCAGM